MRGLRPPVQYDVPNLSGWVAQHYGYLAISFIAILIIVVEILRYRAWRRGWLSELVAGRLPKRKLRQIKWRVVLRQFTNYNTVQLALFHKAIKIDNYIRRKLFLDIFHWYSPSIASFVILVLVIFSFFEIPHPFDDFKDVIHPSRWLKILYSDVGEWESISKVFEALFVVIIALIVFVAESIRGSTNSELRRILLRRTYLWPLVLVVSLTPLGYLYAKPTGFAIIFAVLVASIAIWAFARVLIILVSPDTQERNRRKLLSERVRPIIMESVRERIGNNILYEKIGVDKQIKIEYTLFRTQMDDTSEPYIRIGKPSGNILINVNLVELKNLIDRLEVEAARLGFSLYHRQQTLAPATERAAATTISEAKTVEPRKAYLLLRYREAIPPDSIFSRYDPAILALPPEFSRSPGLLTDVELQLRHIFDFSDAEPSSTAFRRELQGTKDQLVSAIRSTSLGAIDELRETYVYIAELFLETLYEFGGVYSPEQADRERGNIFEGWTEVRWLQQDIRELLVVVAGTRNADVARTIAYLPISIATRAVQIGDHFVFRTFVSFAPFMYYLASESGTDPIVARELIQGSWRYLKELSDFYIVPLLTDRRRVMRAQEIGDAAEFGVYALRTLLDLLKAASDKDDIETFRTVLTEYFRLYRNVGTMDSGLPLSVLEMMVERAETDADRARLRAELSEQRSLEAAVDRLSSIRDQFVFTLATRLLAQFRANPGDQNKRWLFELIRDRLPENLDSLARVFIAAGDIRNDWTWQWDVVADGEAHWVDAHSKPNQLFCARALQLLANMTPAAIAAVNLPTSRDLATLVQLPGTQGLDGTLSEIQEHRDQWEVILTQDQLKKIDDLRNIFRRMQDNQKREEEEQIKIGEVDPEKFREFKSSVRREMLRTGHLRPLMVALSAYRDLTSERPGEQVPSWGFNQLDTKEAFLKNWHVSFVGWGENYGRGLASSEDEIAFKAMIEGAGAAETIPPSEVVDQIFAVIQGGDFEDPIVLNSIRPLIANRLIESDSRFTPKYDTRCTKTVVSDLGAFAGVFNVGDRPVPICDLFTRTAGLENKILIADFARFVAWKQYSPVDDPSEMVDVEGFLFIRVIDLNKNDERRNAIVAEDPTWLRDETDKDAFLRKRVVINAFEKFKIEIQEPTAALVLHLKDVDLDDT